MEDGSIPSVTRYPLPLYKNEWQNLDSEPTFDSLTRVDLNVNQHLSPFFRPFPISIISIPCLSLLLFPFETFTCRMFRLRIALRFIGIALRFIWNRSQIQQVNKMFTVPHNGGLPASVSLLTNCPKNSEISDSQVDHGRQKIELI